MHSHVERVNFPQYFSIHLYSSTSPCFLLHWNTKAGVKDRPKSQDYISPLCSGACLQGYWWAIGVSNSHLGARTMFPQEHISNPARINFSLSVEHGPLLIGHSRPVGIFVLWQTPKPPHHFSLTLDLLSQLLSYFAPWEAFKHVFFWQSQRPSLIVCIPMCFSLLCSILVIEHLHCFSNVCDAWRSLGSLLHPIMTWESMVIKQFSLSLWICGVASWYLSERGTRISWTLDLEDSTKAVLNLLVVTPLERSNGLGVA